MIALKNDFNVSKAMAMASTATTTTASTTTTTCTTTMTTALTKPRWLITFLDSLILIVLIWLKIDADAGVVMPQCPHTTPRRVSLSAANVKLWRIRRHKL